MITSINGKEEPWTEEILAKWQRAMAGKDEVDQVTRANYFTPRPYRNEYDRGSKTEGFVYVIRREVYYVNLSRLTSEESS